MENNLYVGMFLTEGTKGEIKQQNFIRGALVTVVCGMTKGAIVDITKKRDTASSTQGGYKVFTDRVQVRYLNEVTGKYETEWFYTEELVLFYPINE